MSMKNPVTPDGIEPATYRFVAQHLNHCVTAVPDDASITSANHDDSTDEGILKFRMPVPRQHSSPNIVLFG